LEGGQVSTKAKKESPFSSEIRLFFGFDLHLLN